MSKAMIQAIKAHTDIRGEVGVKWCDDAEIQQLNHQFRGIDKPTNVLSFPNIVLPPEESADSSMGRRSARSGLAQPTDCASSKGRGQEAERAISPRSGTPCDFQEEITGAEQQYLGDIAISLETIKREAAEQGKVVEEHLAHMLIHGVLHLLGHDHEKKSEAKAMETLEINILASLGIDNPYE